MPSLRDELEFFIGTHMADTFAQTDHWRSMLMGREPSLLSEGERMENLIRWNEALHEGLLWLADKVEAGRASI